MRAARGSRSGWWWALLVALLLFPAVTAAQPGVQHIRPRLEAESLAPASGQTVALALAMSPAPTWHGYWSNPGDAGVPLTIRWRLPEGVTVGGFAYPVPTTLRIAGLMNHIYERDYALLTTLAIPPGLAPGTPLRIEGDAEWLACTDEVCVPEQGIVSLNLMVGNGRIESSARQRFDRWRAALPRPLGGQARFEMTGGRLRIAVPLPADVAVDRPHFFTATENAADYAAPQAISRNGDTLVIETASEGAVPALSGVLRIDDRTGLAIEAVPGAVPIAGEPLTRPERGWAIMAVMAAIGAALLGGLILNVMPCVFPILSLKALSLAKIGGDASEAKREALAYTAGVVLTCLALGGALLAIRAGGAAAGWAFQLQSPAIVLGLFLLMVAITLNLAGLFDVGTIGLGNTLASRGRIEGAFWTGALAAFVATPCTGPFMAAALGAALVVPTVLGLAIFAALGLGLALPFLLIAYWPALRARLPRPGPWMDRFRKLMAIPMGLTAVALLWLLWRQAGNAGLAFGLVTAVALAGILWWTGRRALGSVPSPTLAALAVILLSGTATALSAQRFERTQQGIAHADAFTEQRLAALRAKGRPVFVYFTADWCLTCKVNERAAIERDEVAAAFRKNGVEMLVGDWTNGDPAIGRFLERHGRSGVPLYLYYAPRATEPRVLPQVLTADTLVALVS